ncbi:unnamed protein product [Urochloa humidicola]
MPLPPPSSSVFPFYRAAASRASADGRCRPFYGRPDLRAAAGAGSRPGASKRPRQPPEGQLASRESRPASRRASSLSGASAARRLRPAGSRRIHNWASLLLFSPFPLEVFF